MTEFIAADALKKLIDLLDILGKSRGEKRRVLFENILQPFNDDFVEVHDAYENMFFNTWVEYRKLPDAKTIGEILLAFRDARDKASFEKMRDLVRGAAQEVLQASDDPDYRRYMCSFFYYFLDDTGKTRSPSFYDQHADAIILKGGRDQMDTPASRIIEKLLKIETHEDGEKVVADGIAILTKRFSDSQKFFWRFRRRVYVG